MKTLLMALASINGLKALTSMRNNAAIFLKVLAAIIVSLFIFSLFFGPLEFEDNWWHLATGRWIVQHGSIPHEDLFPFTDKPVPWIFTQWLGSTILYLVYAVGNLTGLKFFRFFVLLLPIFLFILYNRKKIPFYYLIILIVFLVRGVASRALLRPMIFNMLFIPLFLMILLEYEKTRDFKKLLWLVPFGVLWSNLHLGSFVYGTMLIGVFLFSALIDYGNFLVEKKALVYAQDRIKPLVELSGILVLFWLSMAINPYGLDAMIYPWKTFVLPKFIHFYQSTGIIQEMLAPNIFASSFWWFYPLPGLILFSAVASLKDLKNKFTVLLFIVLSLFLLLYAHRGADFAMIVLVYMLALLFPSEKQLGNKNLFVIYQKIVLVFIFLFMGNTICLNLSRCIVRDGIQERFIFRNYHFPDHQKGMRFLGALGTPNRVFCPDMLGGHIIWNLYPKSRPFVDGRQLDQHIFFDQYVPWLYKPLELWESLDKEYDFQVAFLGVNSLSFVVLARYLNDNPSWELALVDGPDVLFVKKGLIDISKQVPLANRLNNSELSSEEQQAFQHILTQKVPWYARFFIGQSLLIFNDIQTAMTFFDLGFRNHAIRMIINLRMKYKDSFEVIDTAKIFDSTLTKIQMKNKE